MKKFLLSLLMLTGAAAVTIPAAATPFVTDNSSYNFYISQGNETFNGVTTFDGQAGFAPYFRNLTLSVTESETDLNDGRSLIRFELSANGNLFTLPEEEFLFGIGTDASQNGFDFDTLVDLESVVLTLIDTNGVEFDVTEGLEGAVDQPTPWNGLFLGIDNNLGLSVDDATRIGAIRVDFIVRGQAAEVPEPGSVLLCGVGLMAAMGALRRRRRT